MLQLCAGAARIDAKLPGDGARLILGCGGRDRDLAGAVAVEVAEPRDHAAEGAARIRIRPVPDLRAGRRRQDPDTADTRAVDAGIWRADREIAPSVAVEVIDAADPPTERATVGWCRIRAEHGAVLAAHEIHEPVILGGCADEEVGATVAVLVACERQIPPEVLALRIGESPKLLPGLRRECDDGAVHAAADLRVRRRDHEVREPITREIRDRHDPMPEEPFGRFAVPCANDLAGGTRPDARRAVLLVAVPELEARAGGDVGTAVAVDVEWLAEAKAELSVLDAAREAAGDAPTGAGRRAAWNAVGRSRNDEESSEKEGGEERGAGGKTAAPARGRRRQEIHLQQPTQALPEKLH